MNHTNSVIVLFLVTFMALPAKGMHTVPLAPNQSKKTAEKTDQKNGLSAARQTIVRYQTHRDIQETFAQALPLKGLQTLVISFLSDDWIEYKKLKRSSFFKYFAPISTLSFSANNAHLVVSLMLNEGQKDPKSQIIWNIANTTYTDRELALSEHTQDFKNHPVQINANSTDNAFRAAACNNEWGIKSFDDPKKTACSSTEIEINIFVNAARLLEQILQTKPQETAKPQETTGCIIS